MTTIAVNQTLGIMAADSLASFKNGAGTPFTTRKLHRIETGNGSALIATAGLSEHGRMLVHWYSNGADLDNRPNGNNAVMLVLDASGLYFYGSECYPLEILDPLYAYGSGGDYALAAMHLGKRPDEAVKLACKLDPSSGEPVCWKKL